MTEKKESAEAEKKPQEGESGKYQGGEIPATKTPVPDTSPPEEPKADE